MTTIRDLLNDMIMEITQIETEGDDPDYWNEEKDRILDEYIETIKERIVG